MYYDAVKYGDTFEQADPDTDPSVRILSPLPYTTSVVNTPVYLQANDIQDRAIKRVEFFANDSLLFVENSYPFVRTWTPKTPGTYEIKATGYTELDEPLAAPLVILNVVPENSPFQEEKVILYPNPASDFIEVSSFYDLSHATFEFLGTMGERVLPPVSVSNNIARIDVRSLSGQYRLNVLGIPEYYSRNVIISR